MGAWRGVSQTGYLNIDALNWKPKRLVQLKTDRLNNIARNGCYRRAKLNDDWNAHGDAPVHHGYPDGRLPPGDRDSRHEASTRRRTYPDYAITASHHIADQVCNRPLGDIHLPSPGIGL
jgi:hypothetical protein